MSPLEAQQEFVGREWAFHRVHEWATSDSPCLVITGSPGAGKSAFAERLNAIAHGKINAPAGCSRLALHAAHWCSHHDVESISPVQVIAELADQLAKRIPDYAEALVRAGHATAPITFSQNIGKADSGAKIYLFKHLTLEEPDPREAWNRAIRRPFQDLEQQGKLSDVVILIDGLDEAVEGNPGYHLAHLLSDESLIPAPRLRLVVTTRPGQAADHLRDLNPCRFDLTADQPRGENDIEKYARLSLGGNAQQASHIAASSHGSFLYAVHAVAEFLSSGTVTTWDLPVGLAELYRAFLKRHIGRRPAPWREAYRPVLGAIAEAQGDGLTRVQLIAVVGAMLPQQPTVDDVVDDVLVDCYAHLHGDLPEGPFRIGHRSFREYLRTRGEHHIYPAKAHNAIVTAFAAEVADGWLGASAYTRNHLLVHALAVGRCDEFLQDLTCLLHASTYSLQRALSRTPSEISKNAAAICGPELWTLPEGLTERRVVLHLEAVTTGREDIAQELLADVPPHTLSHALRWAGRNATSDSTTGAAWVMHEGRPHIVTGGADELVLRDLVTGEIAVRRKVRGGAGRIAMLPPDLVATVIDRNRVVVLDGNLEIRQEFLAHEGYTASLSVGAEKGRTFLLTIGSDNPSRQRSSKGDCSYRVWDISDGSGADLVDSQDLEQVTFSLSCSQVDGELVAAYRRWGSLQLRAVASGRALSDRIRSSDDYDPVNLVDTSLAVVAGPYETTIFSLPECWPVFATDATLNDTSALLLHSGEHGLVLLTAGIDGVLRVFVPPNPTPRQKFYFDSYVRGLALGPSGELIVTTGHRVAVFDLRAWLAYL
ncbi:AAA family ATPase [Lentzea sp. NPDC058450]|uniref:AAA family ATPase n=1 Tax=Lentzea sp. NPDC058450 TaxID=3346505 RepID=UPI00364F2645